MTANFGRPDLDHLVEARHIAPEEPKFLLRARDPAAAIAVRAWAEAAHQLGVSPAVIEEALQQADAMDRWPVKQRPGDDHLTDDQAKQLIYQLGRRAWKWSIDGAPGLDLILAFQRGANSARAEHRAANPSPSWER